MNGQRYNDMINDVLIPKANEMNVIYPYFQQDGATCHTTSSTWKSFVKRHGKIDLKIWRRWVAGKISRSFTFGLFLMGISQGKGLPQQANKYHLIEVSYWRRNSIDWTGNADQSHEQPASSCRNLCAIRGTAFKRYHSKEVVV